MKVTRDLVDNELINYRPIRRMIVKIGMAKAISIMNNEKPPFPIWVCLKMNEYGLSQRDLANKMNMDETLLSRLLNGKRPLNINHIKKFSDALEVEPVVIWDLVS